MFRPEGGRPSQRGGVDWLRRGWAWLRDVLDSPFLLRRVKECWSGALGLFWVGDDRGDDALWRAEHLLRGLLLDSRACLRQ